LAWESRKKGVPVKSDFYQALIFMILMTLMTALGQILLKIGVSRQKRPHNVRSLFFFILDLPVLGGLLLALAAPFVYLKALSHLSLGELYGLNGLSYFFVFILSRIILKERGNWFHWAGLILIALGIALWSGGGLLG
jgi:drug/metabolite transporter (DMT)-like permease